MFQASRSFTGSRPGYAFYMGPKGLGYYPDAAQSARLARQAQAPHQALGSSRGDAAALAAAEAETGADQAPELNPDELVKTLRRLREANLKQRAKYAHDPQKFLESETDLHVHLSGLDVLSTVPVMYSRLTQLGLVHDLVELMQHDNVDIAVDAIRVLSEMLDPDTLFLEFRDTSPGSADDEARAGAGGEDAEQRLERIVMAIGDFVREFAAQQGGLQMLVQNLSRLLGAAAAVPAEGPVAEEEGISLVFSVVESLVELEPTLARPMCEGEGLLAVLLRLVDDLGVSGTRSVPARSVPLAADAAELVSVLLQTTPRKECVLSVCPKAASGSSGALGRPAGSEHDTCLGRLLKLASALGKTDSKSDEQGELVVNVFDSLCAVLISPEVQRSFGESGGIEALVEIARAQRFAAPAALRALDYATSSDEANCVRLVQAGGLKVLFPIFMGKLSESESETARVDGRRKSRKRKRRAMDLDPEPHAINVLSSLASRLPQESIEFLRLARKFEEGDFLKTDRLLELFEELAGRVGDVEDGSPPSPGPGAAADEDGLTEGERRYLARLDAGLEQLQSVAVTIGALWRGASHVRNRIRTAVDESAALDLAQVKRVLVAMARAVAVPDASDSTDATSGKGNESVPLVEAALRRKRTLIELAEALGPLS